MVSVMHGNNLQILTAEHGSFPGFSWVLPGEWRNCGMAEWRNGRMAEWQIVMDNGPSYLSQIELKEWQKRQAARSSCAVLRPCFVNRKKVRSFIFPGALYMRTQERCHRRCIYGQFKYLTNDQHTTINLRRHPMNADGVCNTRKQSPNSYRRTWILSVVKSVLPGEWRNGGMAEWRNGGMAEWQNGGIA
jgi:hypothetical protein